jgi:hypothetical protein
MDDDNLMPNDGAVFSLREPEQQSVDRKKEKAQTLEALPVLKDLLERLNERIAFYGSVDAIPDEVKTDPKQFLIVHNANELTRDNLRSEVEWINGLVEEHAHKR